jgi:PD-(D/E)XK nuclease superfamily
MPVTGMYMEPWNKDKHPAGLRTFDNVKLVALSTCPTFGIVRYELHKTYKSGRRAMPLETGIACHEAFSAVRLADLYLNGNRFYPEQDVQIIAFNRAVQLFGLDRADAWRAVIEKGEDTERAIMLGALEIFNSTGFYDDEYDKRRTVANIEEAIIVYCTRYPIGKVMPVLAIAPDGKMFVGVEIGIDMYLRIDTTVAMHEYHFVGRIDALMYRTPEKKEIYIEDDKTASRLDDAWRASWAVNHQPTGYCVAASALTHMPVTKGNIRGLAIPIPKTYDYGGHIVEPFSRTEQQFTEWAEWVVYIDQTTKPFLSTPLNAPKFTHSCNRYFHACPYIPFCDSDMEDRQAMLDEMETEEWTPLEAEVHG